MGNFEFRDAARGELRFMKGRLPFRLADSSQFSISVRSCSTCQHIHPMVPLPQFPLLRQLDGDRDQLGWTILTYTCPDTFQQATVMLSPADAEHAVRAVNRG